MKGMEDLFVCYDDTVRDSNAIIIQFTYGSDGRDPSQMEGKSGFPLNFDRLLNKVKVLYTLILISLYHNLLFAPSVFISNKFFFYCYFEKATCPAGQHRGMSPTEICEMVDERLSMHDMSTEGGCSEDFRRKLKEFLEKKAATLEFTRRVLNGEESLTLENVAQSICGITSQQLKVFEMFIIFRYACSPPKTFSCYLHSLLRRIR